MEESADISSALEARPDEYIIHLPMFDGPFDLLLFFIQRDELDIYDIPIAKITSDFLAYIEAAEKLQINLASDFIVVAAQLMKIKGKMLIPRPVVDEEGNEVDPREELVEQLLLTKRFKEAKGLLEHMEDQARNFIPRGFSAAEAELVKGEEQPTDELVGISLYRILQVYERLLKKRERELQEPTHVIRAYPYEATRIRTELLSAVEGGQRIGFVEFIQTNPDRYYVVFSFLSILELIAQQKMRVVLGEGFNNFWMEAAA